MEPLPRTDIDHILTHTTDIWEGLRDARLFITGGTGFVGKWLLESLVAADHQYKLRVTATILTRDAERFKQLSPILAAADCINLIEGDIRTFQYPNGQYSHVIHAASDMTHTSPLQTYDTIAQGTRHLLDFIAARNIKNLLLISSGAVYGKQPTDMSRLSEDYSGAPLTTATTAAYGNGKRVAEWLTSAYSMAYGFDYKIARLFAVTGPYLPTDAGYAAADFVDDLIKGHPISIKGDGTAIRSYLYAADMSIWMWKILLKGTTGAIYNVGSENPVNILELAHKIAAFGTPPHQIDLAYDPDPSTVPDRYIPSTNFARTKLGLQQWILLEEGLRRMIAWNRSESY